ncbi:exodeoxyribonuclease VII large subunit [Fusobacterium ulcerans]|uniref:exodeoxyribonuclease VII large subunit n=1 Tax=Fusobacterium ulcerans TaxID=861 RepID=UPI00103289CB|nr:exodeoxyribonuclease VII large subunit [Fusobacterium ulcerans]
MEIIHFNSIVCTELCKIQGYLNFTSEKKVTLIGRYVETKLIPVKNFYLTIFEDLEKNNITVKIPEKIYIKYNQFEKNCVYKIQGLLTIYSDQFSDSMKTYVQVKIDNIEEIKKLENSSEYTPDYQKLLNDKNGLLSIMERKKESKIFSKDFITSKISNEEKINFLVLTSNLFEKNGKTSDILNDLYSEEEIKENIEKNEKQIEYNKKKLDRYFNFSSENDKNIIRSSFNNLDQTLKTIDNIKTNYLPKQKYDYLVIIKGGGITTNIFNNIELCKKILELDIPIITALGHADDNDILLCKLADININTPSILGKTLLDIIKKYEKKKYVYSEKKFSDSLVSSFDNAPVENENIVQKYKKEIDEKNKIISLHENNIRTLKLNVNEKNNSIARLKEENEEKNRELSKRRFQLIICFVIIIFLILLSVFFKLSESKVEVIEEIKPIENVTAALPANKGNEEDKKKIQKDEEVEKVEISAPKKIVSIISSLPAPEKIEVKPAEKVKTEKIKTSETTVPPKPKKLVYSEDEVYTRLIWKGYRGERALYEFQRDNGMPQTGKIDEKLLNKLGIKPRFK